MPLRTRDKMVAGAVDLLRRRGVHATSLREVVHQTGTPRGSIGHHFPGGKGQLLEEAVTLAAAQVGGPLERLLRERGVVGGLRAFVEGWRRVLLATEFQAGCPVLAVAVEEFSDDARTRAGAIDAEAQKRLLDLADKAFLEWQRLLAAALRREGVRAARARRLAGLVVASVEGTVAMCRAARSTKPLDDVARELDGLLAAAVSATNADSPE